MEVRVILYSSPWCYAVKQARSRLQKWDIPFEEIDVTKDEQAARIVKALNRGYRSTPTLIIGEGKLKYILTEPSMEELDRVLQIAGIIDGETGESQS